MKIKESKLDIDTCSRCKTDEKMSVSIRNTTLNHWFIIECDGCNSMIEQDLAYKSIDTTIKTWNSYQK